MTEHETREPQKHTGFLLRLAQQKHVGWWQAIVGGETTNVQYGVLSVLSRRPGASQKDLCEELELDRSTVADVCVRMERSGLVAREAAPEDRRRNVLTLTVTGRAELERIRPLVDGVQDALTQKLTAQEHEDLRELLAKLVS